MSLFRSALMNYYELYIPKEEAYSIVSKLAPYSFVQFADAAPNNFHKPYYLMIRRCEQITAKIDHVLLQACKLNFLPREIPIVADILKKHEQISTRHHSTNLSVLEKIEREVVKIYDSVDLSSKSLAASQSKIIDLQDYKYLLFKARQIFASKKDDEEGEFVNRKTLEQLTLANISGVIFAQDMLKFTKMIFRASKENSILYTFNIPNDSKFVKPRVAFIIIIENGITIVNKVNRICDAFNAKKYTLPISKQQIFDKIKNIEDAINDTKQLCMLDTKRLKEQLQTTVSQIQYGYSKFQSYRIILERENIIYQTLNLLLERYNSMIAKIWIPDANRGLLFQLLPSTVSIRQPQTLEKPPTHFQINDFTSPFQDIINTYGTPRYQQINPALFAIAIFPCLFGIMFGDIGHGGVLLCFALWIIYSKNGKQLLPDIYAMRYLLLMMGVFATYAGFIYNQFFSIPINIFGSCYGHAEPQEHAAKIDGCVYPIGFDPKWIRASNQLNFFNSYKMKFAVIIGVSQMTLGIVLKMLNTLYFKNFVDFFFQWLPQQIFFFCTFGYMCILIIFKWSIPWGIERDTAEAPSIIAQMIAFPLKLGSTEGKPLWNIQSQQTIQYYFLIISLICVPWMLICKPLILWSRMKKQAIHQLKDAQQSLIQQIQNKIQSKPKQAHDNHEDISEIAVHQIIQTIEFVLGTISNTASYLRLWALSLAHGQLSKVFLQKTIGGGIQSANTIVIAVGMYFFFNITVGVIMGMDIMQCFLHALRLQWVEFDSKFFKADGRKFTPLCIEAPIQAKVIKLHTQE